MAAGDPVTKGDTAVFWGTTGVVTGTGLLAGYYASSVDAADKFRKVVPILGEKGQSVSYVGADPMKSGTVDLIYAGGTSALTKFMTLSMKVYPTDSTNTKFLVIEVGPKYKADGELHLTCTVEAPDSLQASI